jgi:hypothetical protein
MKRFALFLALVGAGFGLLVHLSGGLLGPAASRAKPDLEQEEAPAIARPSLQVPGPSRFGVEEIHAFAGSAEPRTVHVRDPGTGEEVLVPAFLPWMAWVHEVEPEISARGGRQVAKARDVVLVTYREPETAAEARALSAGDGRAYDALVKWRVTAPEARADFLVPTRDLDERPSLSTEDATILLTGGVRLHDVEESMVVTGESIELRPYAEVATGAGTFHVRHEAFDLTGQGLDLRRNDREERLVIERNAEAHVYDGLPGRPQPREGAPFPPATLRSEGRALMVREATPTGGRERLTLTLERRVHMEQVGGRSLDAERAVVLASRPAARGAAVERWHADRFEADGGVTVETQGTGRDGRPYVASASAARLVREDAGGGLDTLLLEGEPVLVLRGEIPLEGVFSEGPSVLRATCRTQAWFGPSDPSQVPPGAPAALYRRLVLRDGARVERRDAGADPVVDTLEGEEMTLLFRSDHPSPEEPLDPMATGLVAVAFAAVGDVRLGGTRMTGTTPRLIGEALDTEIPSLVAEGEGTSFAFFGFSPGQRMVGRAPPEAGAPGEGAPGDGEAHRWVLERLGAGGGVVVETSLGGPSIGLPASLEGDLLGYDRVSDVARVQGTPQTPARVAYGGPSAPRHALSARALSLERAHGLVIARGSVHGEFRLAGRLERAANDRDLFGVPTAAGGAAATLGVATHGRIEIRPRRATPGDAGGLGAQEIHIEGGVVAELRTQDFLVDTLRASFLDVSLRQVSVHRLASPTAASGRAPMPAPSAAAPDRARSDDALSLWTLSADVARASLGEAGLDHVEATGEPAVLDGEDGRIEGARLAYDARERRVTVEGTRRDPARGTFGTPDEINEVRAEEIVVTLDDGGARAVRARAPANATLIQRKADGAVERFHVACDGDIHVTPDTMQTRGAVEIRHRVRSSTAEPWQPPAILWTDQLDVYGSDLLTRSAADLRRIVASGPQTTFQSGEGADQLTIWGERFDLDVPTSIATLTGTPGRDVVVRTGPRDQPEETLEQTRVVVDLAKGFVHEWDHGRIIWRRRSP